MPFQLQIIILDFNLKTNLQVKFNRVECKVNFHFPIGFRFIFQPITGSQFKQIQAIKFILSIGNKIANFLKSDHQKGIISL